MVGLRGWLEESASINGYSMSVHMSAPAIGICSLAGKLAFWHCTTFHQGLAFTVGQRGRGFSTFQSAPWDIRARVEILLRIGGHRTLPTPPASVSSRSDASLHSA